MNAPDPWIKIAEDFDRDDGLDEYFGETKQQMIERWDREHQQNGKAHKPNGKARTAAANAADSAANAAPKIVPEKESLSWLDMSQWDDEPVPERKWAIKDRVPLNQAGLFSGEGGAGKSIIELMKNVAHVTGKDWLGSLPEPGPAFYLGAEDDKDELHIRLAAIAKHYGATFSLVRVEWADGTTVCGGILGHAFDPEALAREAADRAHKDYMRQQPNVVLLSDYKEFRNDISKR